MPTGDEVLISNSSEEHSLVDTEKVRWNIWPELWRM